MDDAAILILRVFALVAFCWLLAQALRSFGANTDRAVWRSRVAVALLWLALTYTSTYTTLLYLGVPVNREVGDVAIGALSIAVINAVAAVASLYAFRPWKGDA